MLQPNIPPPTLCDRALAAKDSRFDGLFFTAVRTTGTYCRPVCPAPTPKQSNVTYFPAAAASAGYRPCLRCRPALAPGFATWGREHAVQRALSLIAEGALDEISIERLATKVGLSGRQSIQFRICGWVRDAANSVAGDKARGEKNVVR